MGNTILGKRSRNFYKGFNERQLNYIKEKFSVMSEKSFLSKEKFQEQYKLSKQIVASFYEFVDFDQSSTIDEYEFICAVHTFCNMTVSELGGKFFDICTSKKQKGKQAWKQDQLYKFTQICLKYNYYCENKAITQKQIKNKNKNKFKKYDYDNSGSIQRDEFVKMCTKDEDYKNWLYNMGFITKNQKQFNDQIYDLVDSDIDEEIKRHLTKTDANVDKIKRGNLHKTNDDEFQEVDDQGDQSPPPEKKQTKQSKKQFEDNKKIIDQQLKKPWKKNIDEFKYGINQDIKKNQNINSPTQSLAIEYVFGYRSYDCRNNVRFDSKGNVVYHQGSLGISMNKDGKQTYLNEHKDDIICIDVVDDLVVTGQMGTKPSVILWRSTDKQIKSQLIITEQLKQSIGNVALSKNKKLLAVNCNNSDHNLIIYQLAQNDKKVTSAKLKASGSLTKCAVFDLKYSLNNEIIVAVTLKEIIFVRYENSVLNGSRGNFNDFSNSIALCLLPLQVQLKSQKNKQNKKKCMLSGMTNGSIYFWEQDKCIKAVSGHNGSVSALVSISTNGPQLFASGDKSGSIIVWDQKLAQKYRCTLPKSSSLSNMIVSLSIFGEKQKQILVGTKSSKVYRAKLINQLVLNQKDLIASGHSQGHLWALSVDQSKKIFYTGGQDQMLMKWSYGSGPKQNKLLLQKRCEYKIRSLSHNVSTQKIAVGYINGVIEIFQQNLQSTGNKFKQFKNPDKEVLNIVKISKQGKYVVASYSFNQKYYLKIFTFEGKSGKLSATQNNLQLNSKVIAFDISKDFKYIRLNTQAYEYKIFNIEDKKFQEILPKQYNDAKHRRGHVDTQWQSHTTFMSPQTKNFLTQGVSQSDIICCQRNPKNRNVILLGDKYSKIKLFNFPCLTSSIFNKFQGHSNDITGIQFDSQDQFVISIGGQQKSIIVWKYDPDVLNNAKFFQPDKIQQQQQQQTNGAVSAKGEQAGSTPMYKGMIKQPTDFKEKYNAKRDNKLPIQNLKIEHVFGIRNKYIKDEVRNMCKYSFKFDHILFPTACLGVKMKINQRRQQFFEGHKQDIVSFALDSSRKVMATGQMAEKNVIDPRKKIVSILVWDVQTQKLLKKLDGYHTIAVVLLEFSPSGNLLFSVGNDSQNKFAIYDWKSGSILYEGPISGGKVNGISWKSQTQFITCGNDHVKFWQKGKGKQGKFNTKVGPQAMYSCAHFKDNTYITGSGTGKVYLWNGQTTSEFDQQQHKGKVQTIKTNGDHIYTGADDGIIIQWGIVDKKLKLKTRYFDVRSVSVYNKFKRSIEDQNSKECAILSIDFSENKMLIVTRGASVIQCQNTPNPKNSQIIHQGHYQGQLWGLSTTTDAGLIMTGGDDKTVRLWSIRDKKQINRAYFTDKIRAVQCSKIKNNNVVIGDWKSRLHLYDNELLTQYDTYEGKPFVLNKQSKQSKSKDSKDQHNPWIQSLKFSPNSDKICYGTHGMSQTLQIVSVMNKKFGKAISFKGGSSAVNHIDWSRKGDAVAINTQAHEYYYYSDVGGKKNASQLRDQQWATYTRKYGFQSQGIFQDSDHTNINTICRDPNSSILAVGYDDQTIRIFKYPCYVPKQVFKQYYGHSSHVTKIQFQGDKMISIGGQDRTIIVWSVQGAQNNVKKQKRHQDSDDGLDDLDEDVDLPMTAVTRKKKPQPALKQFVQIQNQGDQFMAVKPWLGAIKEPTYTYPKSDGQKPDNVKLQLQHVFGYRAKDCRQNLYYRDQNTIVYHAAAVLIFHNTQTHQQKIFSEHNDDILSIDYHVQKDIILTGQIGPKPFVCLYKDGQHKFTFKAPVTKGVIAVAISPSGRYGVCVGIDQKHTISVLDLQKYQKIKSIESGPKVITKVKWVNDKQFVTVGVNYYATWQYQGSNIKSINKSSPKTNNVSLDIKESDKLILVGGNNSSLTNFANSQSAFLQDSKIIKQIPKLQGEQDQQKTKAYQAGVVQCIKITKQFIACGTKNGMIFFYKGKSLKQQPSIIDLREVLKDCSLNPFQKPQNYCIRAIDFCQEKIIIGTFGSQIYQAKINSNYELDTQSFKIIVKAHFTPNNSWTNQVWGLCISDQYYQKNKIQNEQQELKSGKFILTCSDDSTIRVWDRKLKKFLYCINIRTKFFAHQQKYPDHLKLRAIGISNNQRYVAVGAKDGTVRIFKFQPDKQILLKLVGTFKHAKQWISDIKFAYKTLIVGSHDNGIYVYDFEAGDFQHDQTAQNQGQKSYDKLKPKYKVMRKHSSYITHMDVSRDSCYLQSTCGAYELLFWDLNTGKQITAGASMLKDQLWKTWTCNLGWPVQGIYPKFQDGTFINAVDRSHLNLGNDKTYSNKGGSKDFFLLAVGNDNGKVCIYNYPSLIKNSDFLQGRGHSSHVTNVRWTNDDQTIISTGGEDQCVMIWKVQKGDLSENKQKSKKEESKEKKYR